jgi:diguanylate cyclase (GGDEF)-like protein
MAYRATHDPLTGIKNRSEFEIRLGQLLHQAQAGEGPHSVLFIDLDNFTLINGACGHAAGDEVLQQVAEIPLHAIRARGLVVRIGGDEFAILLEYCPPDRAAHICRKICDQMALCPHIHEDRGSVRPSALRLSTHVGRQTTRSCRQRCGLHDGQGSRTQPRARVGGNGRLASKPA